jgi:hypothetical protein
MKRDLLDESHRQELIKHLQSAAGLPLPDNDLYLGNINFILYEREVRAGNNIHVFQIQWGSKSIFIDKHFVLNKNQNLIPAITDFFSKNGQELRSEFIKYAVTQLNDTIAVELPIKLQEKLPAFLNYRVFVDITRKHKNGHDNNHTCWPQISVFIAWEDEFGEFEEFVFPLPFDRETNHFILDYEEITSAFIRYRNLL